MEIRDFVSIISVLVAAASLLYASKNNIKKDTKDESAQMTTVIVKLENISDGVSRIEGDVRDMKAVVSKHTEEIIRMDESIKSAWKRIEQLEKRKGE